MVSTQFPLHVQGATVRRRGKLLVGPVDLTLPKPGLSLVIGPNGAGKTTFLRMLHGMERLSSGSMTWNVAAQEAHKRQAYVFQTPIMMRRTALDNVAYPLIVHGTPRAQARDIATGWLARVGLADSGTKRAQVLSGGERQKLALARALIRGPELLFLDEPCANLDGRATREIEELLLQARQAGTGIIMATHDMGQARRLAQLMGGTTSNGLSDDILNGGENAPTSDVLFIHRGIIHEHQRANDFFVNPQTPEAQAFINGDIVE